MTRSPQWTAAASLRAKGAKLERAGDLTGALAEYEAAARLAPDDPDLMAALAQLAGRLELHEAAASFWDRVRALDPGRLEAVDGRARALRALGRFDEAVAILRQTLLDNPEEPRLWTTLGATLMQDGQAELAITFFDEALRLDPASAVALYNRGGVSFDIGRLDAAADDFTRARKLARRPSDAAMIDFAAATLALARGDLAAGWDAYETRLSRDLAGSPAFEAPGQRWTPAARLAGRRMLVLAEQGLGDELMFANVLPDLHRELGPEGRLSVAVDPRLVGLFRRSFPDAEVTAHATDHSRARPRRTAPDVAEPRRIELWAPLASLCRRFRRSVADFPAEGGYLRADPELVAHWRAWLGEGPPAVGITWRSGNVLGDRRRLYPALEDWAPVLRRPGLRFVNLQYGECAAELATLGELAGAPILEPPGLDLRNDLDGLAALTVALDLALAAANATAALAGACGAKVALFGVPWSWPRLGADRYPWYPQARALVPAAPGDWAAVMAEAAGFVDDLALGGGQEGPHG